jgi:hypothetical protein
LSAAAASFARISSENWSCTSAAVKVERRRCQSHAAPVCRVVKRSFVLLNPNDFYRVSFSPCRKSDLFCDKGKNPRRQQSQMK